MALPQVPVTVRRLNHEEFQAVGPSLSAACAPRFVDFGPTFGKNYDPSDIFLVAFAEATGRRQRRHKEQPVGFLVAETRDYDAVVSEVKLVCIQDAYRGRTDAFRLLLGLLQELTVERAGGKEARITLDAIDRSGIRFYERFGFVSSSEAYPTQMTSGNLELAPLSLRNEAMSPATGPTPSQRPFNDFNESSYLIPVRRAADAPPFSAGDMALPLAPTSVSLPPPPSLKGVSSLPPAYDIKQRCPVLISATAMAGVASLWGEARKERAAFEKMRNAISSQPARNASEQYAKTQSILAIQAALNNTMLARWRQIVASIRGQQAQMLATLGAATYSWARIVRVYPVAPPGSPNLEMYQVTTRTRAHPF